MQAFSVPLDNELLAKHLGRLVQCKTVSFADETRMDFAAFEKLHAELENLYPLVHGTLEKTLVNGYGLLYRFKGNGQSGLDPILLAAHQDVVPADEALWRHPPFGGEIKDGFVWGRGTMDCKCLILGHMEAIEALLAQGFVPDRDVYVAYGFNEEVLGCKGAQKIAQHLKEERLHFDLVLDEGGMYARGEDYGAPATLLAQVGIFEKGYVDIQLTVYDEGGHASRPKDRTALGVLCSAIDAVEQHPFLPCGSEALFKMYRALLPHLPQGRLRSCVEQMDARPQDLIDFLSKTPQTNALVRTTAAATMAWASPAPNVLPQKAEAVFNLRLAEQDSIEKALAHFKEAISDERVQMIAHRGFEPSRVSDTECEAFKLLEKTIHDSQGDAVIVPVPVAARTDARLYDTVCENIYRFSPFIGHMDLRPLVHAADERTPVDQLHEGVRFYMRLLWRFCTQSGRESV